MLEVCSEDLPSQNVVRVVTEASPMYQLAGRPNMVLLVWFQISDHTDYLTVFNDACKPHRCRMRPLPFHLHLPHLQDELQRLHSTAKDEGRHSNWVEGGEVM